MLAVVVEKAHVATVHGGTVLFFFPIKSEGAGKVEAKFGPANCWGSWLNGEGREIAN